MVSVRKPLTNQRFCKVCVENFATQDEESVDGEGKKIDCPTRRSTVTLKAKEKVAGLIMNLSLSF